MKKIFSIFLIVSTLLIFLSCSSLTNVESDSSSALEESSN